MASYSYGFHGGALILFAIAFILYAVGLGGADSALVFGLISEAAAWFILFITNFVGKD